MESVDRCPTHPSATTKTPNPKLQTLRNMWWGVMLFNPTIALLALGVLPLADIIKDETTVLAKMGKRVGDWASLESGQWLEAWISIDAFIVLAGALLTAYVGVSGLIERMASDRCLPQFLLRRNAWRGTLHNIIFGACVLWRGVGVGGWWLMMMAIGVDGRACSWLRSARWSTHAFDAFIRFFFV
jgi:amino acid transporter